MKSLLIIIACTFGCGDAPYGEEPGQASALKLVWDESFEAEMAPPAIEWRVDRCPSAPGDARTAVVEDGTCYSGLYMRNDHILCAWRGSFHGSAFAHELMHALQWASGIDDPRHERGRDWARVDKANERLAAAGL